MELIWKSVHFAFGCTYPNKMMSTFKFHLILVIVLFLILVEAKCPTRVPEERVRSVIKAKRCFRIQEKFECGTVPANETYLVTECCNGYDNVNGTCVPQCNDCGNGICVKPHECSCLDGYERDISTGKCQVVCRPSCENGMCVSKGVCECHDGFTFAPNSSTVCQPFCSSGCTNGKCISPEVCSCTQGYQHINESDSSCEKICSEQCYNSTCPTEIPCVCEEGYELEDSEATDGPICKPICSLPCINATCIAPNICHCHEGYTIKFGSVNECQPFFNGTEEQSGEEPTTSHFNHTACVIVSVVLAIGFLGFFVFYVRHFIAKRTYRTGEANDMRTLRESIYEEVKFS